VKFLTNLTLGKKITLLTTVGLLLGVGVFSSLGMRAVNRATETMLQDRLTTAHLVADYVDEALERALDELEDTALAVRASGSINDLERQVQALKTTYSQLSIYTRSVYLLDESGEIRWSNPVVAGVDNIDIPSYPSIS
jgi:predicted DNA-binding protein